MMVFIYSENFSDFLQVHRKEQKSRICIFDKVDIFFLARNERKRNWRVK